MLAFTLAGLGAAGKAPTGATRHSGVTRDTGLQHDPGPAAGPGRAARLEYLGQLRTRRSEEIGGTRWGVSCHWIADEHPLGVEQRLEQMSTIGAKWALLVPDGQAAVAYWLGVPMETSFGPARVTVTLREVAIAQPVLVDLLDGNVYSLPHSAQSGPTRFEDLPLADSPFVLRNRAAVRLKQ